MHIEVLQSIDLCFQGWHVALLARGLAQLTQVQEEITQVGFDIK